MPPRMIVVAGPPGSGKSSIFPVSSFGVSCFNADDRAAELNHGSYVGIPRHMFEQASRAKAAGFLIEMRYLALRDFAMHIERVKARADAGGHSASESTLRTTYEASLSNLPKAIAAMDDLWVYDNSTGAGPPRLVLESERGAVRFLVDDPPDWLMAVLESS